MKNVEVLKFVSPEALALAAACAWLDELAVPERKQLYSVALSGGRITRAFLNNVVDQSLKRHASWEGVHFFWADERCVPPTDAESNFLLANDLLFKPLGIPVGQIHRVPGELPPDEGADFASRELHKHVPDGKLNLAFLGVGEDGHVASLFPGACLPSHPPSFYPVIGPKPPPQRITLSYEMLFITEKVWVLASGAGKELVVQASLNGNDALPLGKVLKGRLHSKVFTDITITP